MNFLEAHKLQANFKGGPPLDFLFATSGAADKLGVFFRAAGAERGRSVHVRTLPFNTLSQTLLAEASPDELEVFLLFPWDLVPEADWRSGVPTVAPDETSIRERAEAFARSLTTRRSASIFYVPAPIPPIFADPAANPKLGIWLTSLATSVGADLLEPGVFSLGSYLSTGTPFAGTELWNVAVQVVNRALGMTSDAAKVLVTDLDNVLWRGVIGEDGVEGIRYGPEGVGYRHFLYQSLLAKLKGEGTLLAAVSRNDAELALAPFRSGSMTLNAEDFVVIVASYNAKSSQIREIAGQLNLGLDSFVFVDDNPLEIEEVSRALPQVRALAFPGNDDALPDFFTRLGSLFGRRTITAEDAERTEMYRRRLEGMIPGATVGADLHGFLRDLDMSMVIHDRSRGDRARAIQLINKTNQFNLNGRRVTENEVEAILASGGRLYGASLSDRTGSHGEVIACLIDGEGVIRSLVMSCRVFQRRLEYAFVSWLAGEELTPKALDFVTTPRNEPMRMFLDEPSFGTGENAGTICIDLASFQRAHVDDVLLFAITPPETGIPEAARIGTVVDQ